MIAQSLIKYAVKQKVIDYTTLITTLKNALATEANIYITDETGKLIYL